MASQPLTQRKQQGISPSSIFKTSSFQNMYGANNKPELQNQYSTYKNGLQALAQKIGDVEMEAEEHK